MRAWNCFAYPLHIFCSWVLDYLWGLETVKSYCISSICPSSVRLPMRAWNPITNFGMSLCSLCVRLPMRAWNGYIAEDYQGANPRVRLPMRAWNFIAGVALLQQIYVLDYLWGLETYIVDIFALGLSSVRLPMRAWNDAYLRKNKSEIDCVRLPMRAWNDCHFLLKSSTYKC